MPASSILKEALDRGQKALDEFESKKLLSAFGVPVAREAEAAGPDEAALAAKDLGYPVAVKALGSEILHKSEEGLVAVNLPDEEAVRKETERILAAAGDRARGVVVQAMARGRRELVLGLVRDPQFGPCVMAGLGGIYTEALNDVAFRMAPLDEAEARDMLGDLACEKLLGPFRGEAAADLDALVTAIVGIGDLGASQEAVSEIDVNPVIIGPDGSITAVDALVIL